MDELGRRHAVESPVKPLRPLSLRRWLAAASAALLTLGAVAGCTSIDEWQRQAIFNPARDNPRWFSEPMAGTEAYDVPLANGETLHFWYVPQGEARRLDNGAATGRPEQAAPQGEARRLDNTAPTVLYLHGARWNLNGSVFRIERWHELGFNVLAVDYRGFGRSTEILPSEESAAADALIAFAELKRRQPDPARRFIYGHSLGGALAIDVASQVPPDQLAGLIIEATFTSIPDLLRGMRYGWVPGIGLVVTQTFDSGARIASVHVPLLILHGTADSIVPHTMADELYERAGSRTKQLVKLDGGTHSGWRSNAAEYRAAVQAFVRAAAQGTAAGAAGATAGSSAVGTP